jgi:RNA-binding protein
MADLTARQRAHLKSLAHPLKPLVQIGKESVSAGVAASIEAAFNSRELLKVKLLDTAPDDVRDAAGALADMVEGAAVVQVIGRTIVLYRRHPEQPQIELPRKA